MSRGRNGFSSSRKPASTAAILTKDFRVSSQATKADVEADHKLNYSRFLPNYLYFSRHTASRKYTARILAELQIKPQKHKNANLEEKGE
jgi:hypothetical protein